MRVLLTAVALCAALALPASAFAAGSRQAPYGSLFVAQLNSSPAPLQPPAYVLQFTPSLAPPSATATIICGMTVIRGDSKIDQAIAHRVPANPPKPLITVVQPQICKQ
jgi:hypothetical protein